MDLEPIVVIARIVGRLDVAGSTDLDCERAVHEEAVGEHVVVVANGRNGPHDKVDVLGRCNVGRRAVSRHGIVGFSFEQADTVQVSMRGLIYIE